MISCVLFACIYNPTISWLERGKMTNYSLHNFFCMISMHRVYFMVGERGKITVFVYLIDIVNNFFEDFNFEFSCFRLLGLQQLYITRMGLLSCFSVLTGSQFWHKKLARNGEGLNLILQILNCSYFSYISLNGKIN